jgi:hypothetical protein
VKAFDGCGMSTPASDRTTCSRRSSRSRKDETEARAVGLVLGRLRAAVARIPGVDGAGLITCAPMGACHTGNFFTVEGAVPRRRQGSRRTTRTATPDTSTPWAFGCAPDGSSRSPTDGEAAQAVVVNESFVRTSG